MVLFLEIYVDKKEMLFHEIYENESFVHEETFMSL